MSRAIDRGETTALQDIVSLAAATAAHGISDDVYHAGKRCLIDWIGLALAGTREAPVVRLVEALGGEGGNSRALGLPEVPLSSYHAALVMGTASHALDYDDTDYVNLIHVSSTIWPAIFALSRRRKFDARTAMLAFVAGYEAEDRIGHYLGRKLTKQGWHVSGVIGHFGSAISAGMVLELPPEHLAQAAAICGTAASGLIAAFGTMSKPLQLGRAAADGVTAASLAAREFNGPLGILDSDPGIGRPTISEPIRDWSHARGEWGKPYAVLRNAFKPHASCMITHPIIDAAAALRVELTAAGLGWQDVTWMGARVNPLVQHVAGYARPIDGLQGKFSAAYCCALGLLDGRATPELFDAKNVARADVAHLLSCIDLSVDPAIGEQQAEIRVHLADGRDFTRSVTMAKGNPANPMSDAELSAKFLALAEPIWGAAAKPALDDLWNWESVGDVGRWIQRFDAAATGRA
jgi:2-methylcitrate dehydratase PrpD